MRRITRLLVALVIIFGYPTGVFFWAYQDEDVRLTLAVAAGVATSGAYGLYTLIQRWVGRGKLNKFIGIICFYGGLVVVYVIASVAPLPVDRLYTIIYGPAKGAVGVVFAAMLLLNIYALVALAIVGTVALLVRKTNQAKTTMMQSVYSK